MLEPTMIVFFLVTMISICYDGYCFILVVLNFFIDPLAFNIEIIGHGINHCYKHNVKLNIINKY